MAVRYDWRLTIACIDQSGNEMERARLRGLLGRTRPDAKILRALEVLPDEAGGFPGELVRARQAADGRFLGFLRTTWAAAAAFRLVEGAGSSTSARAVEALTGVGDDRWYPGALAGMLACLAEAGVPASVAVIRRGLQRLWGL